MTLTELFTSIADSIRAKKGTTDLINATDFPFEITNLKTSSGDTSAYTIKQFSTIEEMNASTDNVSGDLAVVYSNRFINMQATDQPTKVHFPDQVVLPTRQTEEVYSSFFSDEQYFAILNDTSFTFDFCSTVKTNVTYTSDDGINYKRTDNGASIIEFTSPLINFEGEEYWNTSFGYFLQIEGQIFDGLFQYTDNWGVAPSQLNVTPDYVYDKTFYGVNGVEEGTLQNSVNLSNEQIKQKAMFYNTFANLTTNNDETSLYSLFIYETDLTQIPNITLSENIRDMGQMFCGCSSLEKLPNMNTEKVTNFLSCCLSCESIKSTPNWNLSSATNMNCMFEGCSTLQTVQVYNIPNVTEKGRLTHIFSRCPLLTDESLNNILETLTTAINYTGTKTLNDIGLTKEQATRCQSLSNYEAFIAAGWSTGY